MFKLQSPSKYSPFDAIYHTRHFFPLHKIVFELIHFDVFQCFTVFCFTSSTSVKCFPLRMFFYLRGKICFSGQDLVTREGGAQGYAIFGQKLLNIQRGVGRCACKSPIMKWKCIERVLSKKKPLKPNAASPNNTSWCTDTDGFLEDSSHGGSLYYKGPTLQKIILGYFGPSFVIHLILCLEMAVIPGLNMLC